LSTKLGLRNAVTAAVEAYGRIDNAVVVPPYEEPDSLLDFTQEKFEKALGRTARGAALALRVIAEHLLDQEDLPETGVERKRQKGAITFILRYAAVSSMPGRFTDTVSQAAIQGVMRAGALELAQHNIRVNAIVSLRPSEERATPWSLGRVPLGRAVLADEIAAAAYFMASAEAAFLTGQSLVLDGGRSTLSGVLD
jgi:NAD(P)-dependent dehydrogenase (short-subunit alcohol dehydrogenase family)